MLFNSLAFLVFLCGAVVVYYALPHRFRWIWLLAASYYFYAYWELRNVAYLIIATASAYLCGKGMALARHNRARGWILVAGLLLNLGMLVFFKYYDFLTGQLEAVLQHYQLLPATTSFPILHLRTPVGLSFFTFSVVTYLVDVYTRRMEMEPHLGRLGLYVSFFPKIFAGPIERARTFLPQLKPALRFDPDLFVSGLQLILWGLFKKVVIADNIAALVDRGFGNPLYAPPLDLVIATYLFCFQIYCDFSGYTDIAIGASRLLGLNLMDNFKRPYLAPSTREFWAHRWHISLATWFRDYMYIPMGGSRRGRFRTYFNLMTVFMVSGIWHAGLGYGVSWAFLIWGALNGLYQWAALATESLWRKAGEILPRVRDSRVWHVLRVLLTFHLIAFTWIFFRAGSITDALTIVNRIFTNLGRLPRAVMHYPFSPVHYMALILIALLLFIEILDERASLWERLGRSSRPVRWGVYYAMIFALLIVGNWKAQEFIYMQF